MRRIGTGLVLALLFLVCLPASRASTGKEGRHAPPAPAAAGPPDTAPVVSARGIVVTVAALRERIAEDRMVYHRLGDGKTTPDRYVDEAAEEALYEALALNAIRGSGFARTLEADLRVVRNRFLAMRYQAAGLPPRLAPTEQELRSRYPERWGRAKFQGLTVLTRAEAEKAREEALRAPGRFTEMVREMDVGPKRSMDGYTFFLDPPPLSGVMGEEDQKHLFTLKPGEFSRVIESELGYSIYRMAEIQDYTAEEVRKKKTKLRNLAVQQKIGEYTRNLVAREDPWSLFGADEARAYRLLLDFLGKGEAPAAEAVRAGTLTLTFEECLRLERLFTWPDNSTEPVPYFQRLRQMVDTILIPEAILADDADRNGFRLEEKYEKAMRSKQENWLQDQFYKKNILPRVNVPDEEVRRFFEENRDSFRRPRTVDYRVIQSANVKKLEEALRRIEKGGAFDDGFSWAAGKKVNQAKGGGKHDNVLVDGIAPTVVRDAVWRLREGGHTRVLEGSGKDRYIVSLDRVLAWEEPALALYEDRIRRHLTQRKRTEALQAFFREQYPDLSVEKNPDAIAFFAGELKKEMEKRKSRGPAAAPLPPHGGGGHR